MGIHVIKSTTAPTVAPTVLQVGAHWVKTTNPKGQWFAVGSDTLADWVDQSAIAGAVARTGDTMTGPLKVPQTLSTDDDNVVATKKYVDDNAGGGGDAYALVSQGGGVSLVGVSLGSDLGVKSVVAGPGIDIVADDYANTITFTPTGGGGGGGENLIDISDSGWTVLGSKSGSDRSIYGFDVGSGLYLDQPGNDLKYYNLGMNRACLPVLVPGAVYSNRLVPKSQDNVVDLAFSYFGGITRLFPIFIDNKRRPIELSVFIKSLGTTDPVQMRVAMYASDPETNAPRYLWSEATRDVFQYEESSSAFSPVSFDIAANASSSRVMPGIYWVMIWAPDTSNITLHAVPNDHALAFGELNHVTLGSSLASHNTPLDDEIFITQQANFSNTPKVPLIQLNASK